MKEMSKVKIKENDSIEAIVKEQNFLKTLKHPFIISMDYSFQDPQNVYIVLDYLKGGDLRYHLNRKKTFGEKSSKFFIACVLLALEYLRENNIVHRDIKPENLVLDAFGYLHLTDFGAAKEIKENQECEKDPVGTTGYMAPEVMLGRNYSFASDYFAIGVLTYELMFGKRPYKGKSRKGVVEQIFYNEIRIIPDQLPQKWDPSAADFINRLLKRKPKERLGFNDIEEIKNHPWLRDVNWDKIYNKEVRCPYKPGPEDNYDTKNLNKEIKVSCEDYAKTLYEINCNDYFKDFYYNISDGPNRIEVPEKNKLSSPFKSLKSHYRKMSYDCNGRKISSSSVGTTVESNEIKSADGKTK